MSVEQEEYHDKVHCTFAENMYQKMVTKRYGIEFCCGTEEDKLIEGADFYRKNEMLNLNTIADPIVDGEVNGEPVARQGGNCLQVLVSAGRGGGVFTYVPCGNLNETSFSFPENYDGEGEVFCYDADAGYTETGLPGEGPPDLTIDQQGVCT